jgi:hypothetical protein
MTTPTPHPPPRRWWCAPDFWLLWIVVAFWLLAVIALCLGIW